MNKSPIFDAKKSSASTRNSCIQADVAGPDSPDRFSAGLFRVKKRTLLAIAGCVWFLAGFNVARLGVLEYTGMKTISWYHPVLSVVVFALFGLMFFKMSFKHTNRIHGYPEPTRPFRHFFDLKAYCIMAVMMGGGIWLRYSGLVPDVFIAVFYTGLGCALALAGICFGVSAFLRRGSIGTGLGIAVIMYFLKIIANLTESAEFLKYITPFGYADGAEIVRNVSLDTNMIAIGLLFAAIGISAGFIKYCRKDIS